MAAHLLRRLVNKLIDRLGPRYPLAIIHILVFLLVQITNAQTNSDHPTTTELCERFFAESSNHQPKEGLAESMAKVEKVKIDSEDPSFARVRHQASFDAKKVHEDLQVIFESEQRKDLKIGKDEDVELPIQIAVMIKPPYVEDKGPLYGIISTPE